MYLAEWYKDYSIIFFLEVTTIILEVVCVGAISSVMTR